MFTEMINSLAQKGSEHGRESDYLGADGLLYCGECHYPRQAVVEEMKPYLAGGICPIPCLCMQEEKENARQETKLLQKQMNGTVRRKECIGGRYIGFTFDADDGSRPDVTEQCRRYVKHFDSVKEEGRGLLFTGDIGSGKTFYACCIANALMDRGEEVWLASQMPLLRACDDFDTDADTFRRLSEVSLLILDDLHTDGLTRRQTELLQEIADARYRSGLPMIATCLLTPENMRRRSSVTVKRIYERILCMCVGKDGKGWVKVSG